MPDTEIARAETKEGRRVLFEENPDREEEEAEEPLFTSIEEPMRARLEPKELTRVRFNPTEVMQGRL